MNTSAPTHPPRRIAAPWLLAATLVSAVSAMTPAAQAALVVTAATRSVSADTSRSAPSSVLSNSTSGVFDAAAISVEAVPNGALATAELQSTIGPLSFSGNGQSALGLANNATGQAEALFDVFFTLTSAYSFSGNAILAIGGNASSSANFLLEEAAGADIVSRNSDDLFTTFDGDLVAGDYHLLLRGVIDSIDPNEGGFARIGFLLNLVEAGPPPAGVPEPSGLALAAVAAVALRGARRRR